MTRTVHCRKYGKELPGLPMPPYPGDLGRDIFENVSTQAWKEWLQHQTMLINEKHLSMADKDDRQYLQGQMLKFFNNEEFDRAEGFVPEEPDSDTKE